MLLVGEFLDFLSDNHLLQRSLQAGFIAGIARDGNNVHDWENRRCRVTAKRPQWRGKDEAFVQLRLHYRTALFITHTRNQKHIYQA